MDLKIFGDYSYFWQWDLDRKLIVEDGGVCTQVHYCNGDGKALVCPVKDVAGQRMADVPNILLQKAETITAYLYTVAEDGVRTRSAHRFNVLPRSKPDEYAYTETEVLTYAYLDKRLVDLARDLENLPPPDWDAQEGEPGHILNRPFGEKIAIREVLPATIVTEFRSANDADLPHFEIVPGNTYLVSYNGTQYELTAEGLKSGNGASLGDRNRVDTPFTIWSMMADGEHPAYTWINVADGVTEAEVAVSRKEIQVEKIDPKYLPDVQDAVNAALAAAKESGEFDGKDGKDGNPGKNGADGFSPTLQVQSITGGHRVTVTDKDGAKYFDVMDGKNGTGGEGVEEFFFVNAYENDAVTPSSYHADKTAEEIIAAVASGKVPLCHYNMAGTPVALMPVAIVGTDVIFGNMVVMPDLQINMYMCLVISERGVHFFLTEVATKDDISGAVEAALAAAKASGEFDGADGKDGKTAYQYAKDGGYSGTETEFAAKLAAELPTNVSDLTNDSKFITAAGAPVQSVNGKTGTVTLDANAVGARPSGWMPTAENVGAVPTTRKVNGKALNADITLSASDVSARPSTWTPSYSDVGADKSGTASSAVSNHNTNTDAHNDIRLLITGLTTRLDALANSDDDTLDQMAEVVAYIKANRDLIDQITTGKVSVSDIVNNLTTNVSNKPLSAAQGVALKALIDAITVPTKLSQLTADSTHRTVTDTEKSTWNAKSDFSGNYADLSGKPTIPTVPTKVSAFTNDAGYITGYTETDPTVPSWAKSASKPSYSKSEVGLGNVDNVKQYSASNPPPYPVTSVNGKTGAVTVDVPTVPTKVSAFTNDAGYLTEHQDLSSYALKSEIPSVPVKSVNGKTGAVSLAASDVGALASASYTTKALKVTYDDGTSETVTLVVAK